MTTAGRRRWIKTSAAAALSAMAPTLARAEDGMIRLFLTGDVMTGRGIDQVLPHPSDPRIYERYAKSALDYVQLAERKNGSIPRPVPYDYIWGTALSELERRRPHVRIVNLETAVTKASTPAPKGINYRMNPKNVSCLTAADIDCCVLANNHVLDWEEAGCVETIEAVRAQGIATAGAGRNATRAARPAVLEAESGRVLVFAFGSITSGIPTGWAATASRPGINLLFDLSKAEARRVGEQVHAHRRNKDIVVASIHWGPNWGYDIPADQQTFARTLIDEGGVDVVHGHSSHHPKGIQIYRGKPILYGCGDFINDYEGISGHERYRGNLALMYFITMKPSARQLHRLELVPLRIERFQLQRASRKDSEWLRDTLSREGRKLGTTVTLTKENTLQVE